MGQSTSTAPPTQSHVVWFSCAFALLGEASRGLVLGSLSTYVTRLGGGGLVGTVVALFSVGRLVSSLLGGWLSKKTSAGLVFDLSLGVNVAGSVLYFFAAEMGLWALILGRILVGFGSGTLSVARAAVAEASTVDTRTRWFAVLDAARFIGYALTPFFSWLLAYVDWNTSGFLFDGTTTPGLLMIALNLGLLVYSRRIGLYQGSYTAAVWKRVSGWCSMITKRRLSNAVVVMDRYEELAADESIHADISEEIIPPLPSVRLISPGTSHIRHDRVTPAQFSSADDGATKPGPKLTPLINETLVSVVSEHGASPGPTTQASQPSHTDPKLVRMCLALLIAVNLVARGILALLETIGAPMFIQTALTSADGKQDSDATQDADEFFLVLGIVGMLVYLLLAFGKLKVPELHLLSTSFVIAAVGCCLLVSKSKVGYARLVLGCGLIWSISAPMSSTITVSTFSKLVGQQPQGMHMGVITAAGSIGRIVFPLLANALPRYVVVIIGALTCLVCALCIVGFRQLASAVAAATATQLSSTVGSPTALTVPGRGEFVLLGDTSPVGPLSEVEDLEIELTCEVHPQQ